MQFYLRTGKSLAEGRRTVTIGFTNAPLRLFPDHTPERCVRPSELVFELSDDPQVRVEIQAKVPGPVLDLGRAALTLDVDKAFDGADGLEAYERLLHDVMLRERLLFTRSEQIERLWEVCAPVTDQPPELQPYAPGSWGPQAAVELPASPGGGCPTATAVADPQPPLVQASLRSHSSAAAASVTALPGSLRRHSS